MAAAFTVRMMGAPRRAGGLHSCTIEVLDQRGVAERFLSQGQVAQVAGFAGVPWTLDVAREERQMPEHLVVEAPGRGRAALNLLRQQEILNRRAEAGGQPA